MKFELKKFSNPTKEYRAKPFWSLNGKLEKAELKKQIENMKIMGFGGAFMHSRTGLKTEYMSDEWLSLMEFCTNELNKNGMEAYLYDEDRWPSGTCGGYVTMDEEYRAKSMAIFKIEDGDALPKNLLGVFAIKFGKTNKIDSYRKIETVKDKKDGEVVYAINWQEMAKDTFYNGYTYIDTMYRPACERFIELTHEKYRKVMGDKFGKEIVGIFTDEPQRGPMFTGFSRKEEIKEDEVPYTPALFEEFKKRMGYTLEDKLPVIWFGKESDAFCKETYDYLEVVQQLFVENFAKPYYDWCQKYNLKFTGHILHEDNLTAQTTLCGSCMRFYEYMGYPGIDNLCSENYMYNVPALVSSVTKQLDKGFCLDELYGVSGWNMNLKDYKRMGDWQALGGITLRCPHLSWYTMEGEAKRDCPASIFHQSSWYKEYHLIEDHFARISYIVKNGEDTTKTAIINPIESTWGLSNKQTYLGCFDVKDPLYKKIEVEYYNLYKDLILNGQSADYIDEGLFAKYGSVISDNFVCGKKQYKNVVLNGNYNLRSTTLSAIKKFIKNGGKVIVVGSMPQYLDGVKHDFTEDLKSATIIDFDTAKLVDILRDDVVITNSKNMIINRKNFDKDMTICLLNQSKENSKVCIKIKTDKEVSLLDTNNGLVKGIDYSREKDYIVINKEFKPFEEIVLLCSNEIKAEFKEEKFEKVATLDNFDYELLEDNMVVLDTPKLYIDGKYCSKKFVVWSDQEVRRTFGLEFRHGEMVQPWFKEKFYKGQDKKYCRVTLEYDFIIKEMPKYLKYMFEYLPTYQVKLNGSDVAVDKKYGSIIDNCFSVLDLPVDKLIEGKNTLAVSFDFYEKTDIEGGFLLGNIAVSLGEVDSICKLPNKLKSGDLTKQGLPCFGGAIKLFSKFDNGSYRVKLDSLEIASIKVNGKSVAFTPFESDFEVKDGKIEIEVYLNRNNCFASHVEEGKRVCMIEQILPKIEIYKKK